MSDPAKTLGVIAEMLKLEWHEERERALEVLNGLGGDTMGADLVTACHVVAGDYRGAMSGLDFWKREAEAARASDKTAREHWLMAEGREHVQAALVRDRDARVRELEAEAGWLRSIMAISLARLEVDHEEGTYDCTCEDDDPCEMHRLKAALKAKRGQ